MKKEIIKTLAVTATLSTLLIGLTGCDIHINIGEKNTENTTKVEAYEVKEAKVTQITHNYKTLEDSKHYLVLTALDENKNTVWTYETDKDYAGQYETIEYLAENNDIIYLNELGTIVATSKNTGKVIWKNAEYKGSESNFDFDEEGYLYICGYISPRLFVVNPEGKTVAKINKGSELPEFPWQTGLEITDGYMLSLRFPALEIDDQEVENEIVIDIRDLKNTENKVLNKETVAEFAHEQIYGFEDIKEFQLSENGVVTISFEPDTDLAKKYEDGKTQIATDVKSITPLFWGNGGYGSLIMIKKDGTVSALDSMAVSTGEITIRNINASDIDYAVQIITVGGQGIGLVDKYGNLIADLI